MILLYSTAIRPGEAYKLRWEHVLLNGNSGLIQIVEGKSRAARRVLPLLPEAHRCLLERWTAQKKPEVGWVFPTESESGHLEESSGKTQHALALKKIAAAHEAYRRWTKAGGDGDWEQSVSKETHLEISFLKRHPEAIRKGLKSFEPYCLRHTALTRLAESGCDAFTLARIAGHSSITITQRYCHPQADAIERAFSSLGGHNFRHINKSVEIAEQSSNAQDVETQREGWRALRDDFRTLAL